MDVVKRGEVWLIALDPTRGREIRKTRPCLVVSPDELNLKLPLASVVPLTSGSRPAPFRVPVEFAGRTGLLLPEQIRSVDRSRLVKRLGTIDAAALNSTLATLRAFFAD
jgi:mRNA interferase MazF